MSDILEILRIRVLVVWISGEKGGLVEDSGGCKCGKG